ncbi:MAG: glycosyltransferase [Propionibacteriaceae bacterium]|jgi:glycosyltransferase involved in cell wall biosynthesis/LmbE family N-acetylglucosaminyl deacetylase|nr:glycosyltransferase [Propionibacteriaceae bacterium]
MPQLRIAMVSMHTSPADAPGSGDAGGMNVVELHAAEELARLGHRVDLITRRSDPSQPDVLELAENLRLLHLTAGPTAPLAKSEIDQYIPQFTEALAGIDADYDIFHSQHWMSGVAALPLARARGVPHVQSFHSVAAKPGSVLAEGEPAESPQRVPGEAMLAQESDLVIAISAAEARTVIERCGANPDRVAIVHPGVDLNLFRPRRECPADPIPGRFKGIPSAKYIAMAARLQPLKAPDLAIRALAEVAEPIRPHLVIAGADSPDFAEYQQMLNQLVAELGLQDMVHFVGALSREDIAWLFRNAELSLVTSHSETFGLVALESAACGTPVIASSAGGLREAVVHGETGQLMDSRQPEDWAVAITKLLSRPKLLERMGTVSRVHARRFTWSGMVRSMEHLYQALLGGELDDQVPLPAHRRHAADVSAARRFLFVHAHPDDETLSTGAAILALAREGKECLVLTATRGEMGEATPDVVERLDEAGLVELRLAERRNALAALGAKDAGFLGAQPNRADCRAEREYSDSGMAWVADGVAGPADDSPAGALSKANLDEVVGDVAAAAVNWRADVLVSYNEEGGYGHPDHVRCHHAAAKAAAQLGIPFLQIGVGSSYDAGGDFGRLLQAHQAYASQFTVVDEGHVRHVGGQVDSLLRRNQLG